ncbi:LysE family translocator [Hyphobacterium marinum]|uniref:LysE family translocator n=1 Tax=Hyphobacterium marinum TaxID=3116574 RepID=A0ABU7LVA8_9PROT|nr:LysE family translocator [Hyphobacterium sp. Y6023]MEE2565499.1 LysE family translocator [Hyphobacterium sp. Y6023]
MTLATLAAFAGAIFVLFFTPGPGNVAMVARTLDAGPVHGFVYGAGIITGDIFWLTVAVTGLTALSSSLGPSVWIVKLAGAGVLIWFAYRAFRSFANPETPDRIRGTTTRLGLAATYLAGVAMPLTNPKPIVFYLSFLPAFFDLSQVGIRDWLAMVAIMLAMYGLTAAVHVGLAHRARDWLKAKGVKRWADGVTGVIMLAVAVLLLVR